MQRLRQVSVVLVVLCALIGCSGSDKHADRSAVRVAAGADARGTERPGAFRFVGEPLVVVAGQRAMAFVRLNKSLPERRRAVQGTFLLNGGSDLVGAQKAPNRPRCYWQEYVDSIPDPPLVEGDDVTLQLSVIGRRAGIKTMVRVRRATATELTNDARRLKFFHAIGCRVR